ncbi:ABC transporter substrate-binding protein [Spirochaetia bacterium]|nr:ABC transporter substrate-binding protein [Spirochaetia bacterium]
MKKLVLAALLCATAGIVFAGGKAATDGKVKIGIAKIVQHPALDAAEQGMIDVLEAAGVAFEYDRQNANGDVNTAAQIAAKFRSERVALAVGIGTPVAVALATAIKDIPVVFATVTDPVGAGLVSTVAHGEGNVTGMSDATPNEDYIRIFKEIANIKTFGYIYTSNEANSISSLLEVQAAAKKLGVTVIEQAISTSSEVRAAAQSIVGRVDGIYLTTDNTVYSALPALIQVFNAAKKPIFSCDVTSTRGGGSVIATGINYYKAGRATGELVLQILNGKKPSDIPVRYMTEPGDNDFLLDLDEAARCGIKVPQKYIDQANIIFQNGKATEK